MKKLYALEDDTSTNNELLIDKILEANKKDKSPLSLTADVIKQRQQLKNEILDKISDTDKESKEDTNIDKESSDEEKDSSKEEDSESSDKSIKEEISSSDENTEETDKDSEEKDSSKEESKDNTDKESSDEEASSKEDTSTQEDEEDISEAAENKDSLKSLIGSGLKEESKDTTSKDKDVNKTKEATESLLTSYKLSLANIFKPIHTSYNKYTASLESFNIPYKLAIEEQPIVYVKESVIESLNNLIQLANNYIANNTSFINNISQAVKSLNERLTIYTQYVEEEKFHFTQKLINDKDILVNLSIPNNSDIRSTIKVLSSYIDDSTKIVTLILNNNFDTLESSYTTNNFEKVKDDLSYKSILPGFNLIKVYIDPYSNYLNTNIQNYQYYKLKVFKTEDIFNLSAITINDDNEIKYILTTANKLIGYISLIVDNLTLINNNFNKFVDEIKVISYDIDKDKYKDLANVGIDDKVKDFIKFKLLIEESIIDINVIIDYLTSLETVVSKCVELKE